MSGQGNEVAKKSPAEVVRRERQLLSAKFLLEVVGPAVAKLPPEGTLSNKQLDTMLSKFKAENPGPGSDIDMGMVQSRAMFVASYTVKDIKDIWPWHEDPEQLLNIMQRSAGIVLNYEQAVV